MVIFHSYVSLPEGTWRNLGEHFQFSWLILRKPQRKLPALGFQKPHLKRSQKLAGTFRNIEKFFRLQLDTYTWGCWQMGYRAPTTLVNYLWILWHRRDPPTGTGLLSGSTLYASRMPHQHFVGVSGAQGTMEWIFGRTCRHPQMFGAQNVWKTKALAVIVPSSFGLGQLGKTWWRWPTLFEGRQIS